MDENGQGDLTPEQTKELANWFSGFFKALDGHPGAKKAFMEHPGMTMRKYLNAQKRQHKQEEKEQEKPFQCADCGKRLSEVQVDVWEDNKPFCYDCAEAWNFAP